MALPPLAPPCGRSVFAGRSLRVVNWDDTNRFIPYNEIPKEKIADCPILAELRSLDPTLYLATYSGFPGLVKGCGYGSGMLVFSENLKYFTRASNARVVGNKIKFEYGSNEFKEDRDYCWEFCVKRERVNIIVPIVRNEIVNYEFKLSRPDNTTCPVCYDELSGNVVECTKAHQTCLKCFNLLPTIGAGQTIKKCVLCNEPGYTIDEYKKVENMNGAIVEGPAYFQISLDGANSYREFCNNEALFMGMIKAFVDINNLDIFHRMLLSSLYNYYMNHKEKGSFEFNLMRQTSMNTRTFNPTSDDLQEVFKEYLLDLKGGGEDNPIYNDVAYTNFYMQNYTDNQFNNDLELLEGSNAWNRLKQYPGDKKIILIREIYFRTNVDKYSIVELQDIFKGAFERIINLKSFYSSYFNVIKMETIIS